MPSQAIVLVEPAHLCVGVHLFPHFSGKRCIKPPLLSSSLDLINPQSTNSQFGNQTSSVGVLQMLRFTTQHKNISNRSIL